MMLGHYNRLDLKIPGLSKRLSVEQLKPAMESGVLERSHDQQPYPSSARTLEEDRQVWRSQRRYRRDCSRLSRASKSDTPGGSGWIFLLKHDQNILPWAKNGFERVALLGPLAKEAATHRGGSAASNCHYKVSLFDVFISCLSSDVKITYFRGMMNSLILKIHTFWQSYSSIYLQSLPGHRRRLH